MLQNFQSGVLAFVSDLTHWVPGAIRGGCLVWLTALLAGCGPPGPRAVWDGVELMDRGDYDQAVEALRNATRLMPTNALAYNYLGLALHHANKPAEAERAYLRALTLNHDLTEVHFNLGCLWLLQTNRLEQARSELTTYTLRNPNSAEGWLKLGEIQLRSRDIAAAEKSLGEALRLDPHNAEALNATGLARLNRKKPNEAAQFFTKAAKEQPGYSPALLNLAIVAQQDLNDPRLAIQKYREYVTLKPAPEDAQAVRTLINKLEQDLSTSLRSVPTNAIVQVPSYTNVLKSPTPEFAESVLPKTATTAPTPSQLPAPPKSDLPGNVPRNPVPAPSNPPKQAPATNPAPPSHVEVVKLGAEPVIKPAEDVGTLSAPVGAQPAEFPPQISTDSHHPTAEAKPAKRGFLQKINPINLFTKDSAPSGGTAAKYATVKEQPSPQLPSASSPLSDDSVKPAAAPRAFPRYTFRSPDKPTSGDRIAAERAFSEGIEQHQARRLSEAIQSYKRAAQLDPAFYDAQYNLALAATDAGNLPLALSTYEIALAIQPESLDARYNLGLVLKQAGYALDAVNQFEKILTKFPNDGRTHLALGNLYAQQLQDVAKAREHYLAVLAISPQSPQAGAIRYWLSDHPK
jgi:tetratricopeptide (TPR) repeat protein